MVVFILRCVRGRKPKGVSDGIRKFSQSVGDSVQDNLVGLFHMLPGEVHEPQRAEDPLQRAAFLEAGDGVETGVEPESVAGEGLEAAAGSGPFLENGDTVTRPGQENAREEAAEPRPYDHGLRHSGR